VDNESSFNFLNLLVNKNEFFIYLFMKDNILFEIIFTDIVFLFSSFECMNILLSRDVARWITRFLKALGWV
jgi:hypothetical protein